MDWEFKPDWNQDTQGPLEDLFDGYIKLDKALSNKEQQDKLEEAVRLVRDFLDKAESKEHLKFY